MRSGLTLLIVIVLSNSLTLQSPAAGEMDQLIPWLLNEDRQLRGIPFSELIIDTTGRKVLPFEANNAVDQRVAKAISAACDETMKRLKSAAISKRLCGDCSTRLPVYSAISRSQSKAKCNVQVIRICALPILRANACFI
jgi:hypothetical protein